MHSDHNIFARAIEEKRKIRLTFCSEEDGEELAVSCAPMDYRPGRRATDASEHYYFWCSAEELYPFEMNENNHVLRLPANRIVSIELAEDSFDPAEFGTAGIHWFLPPRLWRFNPLAMFLKRFFTKSRKSQGADRRAKS